MIRFIIAALTVLLMVGCTLPANFDITTGKHRSTPFNNAMRALSIPPNTDDYPGIATDDRQLYNYADDMNWYMMYQFAHVQLVNRYAQQRGWVPPKVDPLCKRREPIVSIGMPDFKGIPGSDGYKDALESHVLELRGLYRALVAQVAEREKIARHNCMY